MADSFNIEMVSRIYCWSELSRTWPYNFVGSVYTRDQNVDDYEDYDNAIVSADEEKRKEEVEVMMTPEFQSISQRMEANQGDTVRLPCLVDRLEGFVMLWKKKDEILTVASQIIDKVEHRKKVQ